MSQVLQKSKLVKSSAIQKDKVLRNSIRRKSYPKELNRSAMHCLKSLFYFYKIQSTMESK